MCYRDNELQHNLNVWNEELSKRNLKINVNKTKVMVIGKDNKKSNIKINQDQLDQVEAYKYFGVRIQKYGNWKKRCCCVKYATDNNKFYEVNKFNKIVVITINTSKLINIALYFISA